jgi:predicted DNA-binding transcriptional regulator AlpA
MVDAQEEFDRVYITSSEICKMLRISRASLVLARRRGSVPEPILVNSAQIHIWRRSDIQETINSWKLVLQARRKELIG